jgi:hypothetical protein
VQFGFNVRQVLPQEDVNAIFYAKIHPLRKFIEKTWDLLIAYYYPRYFSICEGIAKFVESVPKYRGKAYGLYYEEGKPKLLAELSPISEELTNTGHSASVNPLGAFMVRRHIFASSAINMIAKVEFKAIGMDYALERARPESVTGAIDIWDFIGKYGKLYLNAEVLNSSSAATAGLYIPSYNSRYSARLQDKLREFSARNLFAGRSRGELILISNAPYNTEMKAEYDISEVNNIYNHFMSISNNVFLNYHTIDEYLIHVHLHLQHKTSCSSLLCLHLPKKIVLFYHQLV